MDSGSATFVVVSRFVVANGMTKAVKDAFATRPHIVDDEPGFRGMLVLSPDDNPDEIWLMTYWTDREAYHAWHGGPAYRASHRGIPKGLKLLPKESSLRFFHHVAS